MTHRRHSKFTAGEERSFALSGLPNNGTGWQGGVNSRGGGHAGVVPTRSDGRFMISWFALPVGNRPGSRTRSCWPSMAEALLQCERNRDYQPMSIWDTAKNRWVQVEYTPAGRAVAGVAPPVPLIDLRGVAI